jgi:type IV pilus assembly protein PilB
MFYRKYRPQTLSELDTKEVQDQLSSILKASTIPHAFLFTGPRGTGKTSTARIVAKVLNAEVNKEKITDEEMRIIKKIADNSKAHGKDFNDYGVDMNAPIKIYEAVGCDKCNNTGYKGRMGIFEAIHNDAQIEAAIPTNPSERQIKDLAQNQGSLDMKEDGIVKILKGITSYSEVGSVVDFYEE